MRHKERFLELDALRGIAALVVILFHLTGGYVESTSLFKLGTTGVDLFFIISGFVIFMSLNSITKSIDFVINRISRLYPTYWTSVSFTFLLIITKTILYDDFSLGTSFLTYLANMTMFQFYLRVPDIDGPYWTMIIEMIFYIFMILLFQFRMLNKIVFIGFLICIYSLVSTYLLFDLTIIRKLFYGIPLLQFFPLFFAGILFFKMYSQVEKRVLYSVLLIFCLFSQIALFDYSGRSNGFINWIQYSLMLTIYFTLFFLFIFGKLKFIKNRITVFLGKISFSLYLIHQYISIHLIIPYFHDILEINFWVVLLLINIPLVVLIATIITFYIEIPYTIKLKNALKKFTSK